jgi:hypothetical protein
MITFPALQLPDRMGATQGLISPSADNGLVYRAERGVVAFAVPHFGEYLRGRPRLETC